MRRFVIFGLMAGLNLADWPDCEIKKGYPEDYPEWAALFGRGDDQYFGYKWTPYVVTTEDGWDLTLFQIMASDYRFEMYRVVENYTHVLFLHGQD